MRPRTSTIGFLLGALLATGGAPAAAPPVRRARWLMGTLCAGEVHGLEPERGAAALSRAFDEIARVESLLSTWREDSELSRVNRRAHGERVKLTSDLASFLETGLRWSQVSGGAFDPTVGPLVQAWDLRGAGRVPSPAELAAARAAVGASRVVLDGSGPTVRYAVPGLWIDPGGIGKGWALDRAADLLREEGPAGALLDLGGQLLALGRAPGGGPWPVAVARPGDRNRPALVLSLAGGSVATSSQGERGRSAAGRWLGHILDPRTGEPVPRSGSVSVVAESATAADALATALFVMGPGEGLAWARGRDIAVGYLERVPGGPDGPRLRLRANPRFRSMVIASPTGLQADSAPPRPGAGPEG